MLKVLSYILYDLDPKVKVIGKKSGYLRWCTIDCCSSYMCIELFTLRKPPNSYEIDKVFQTQRT